MVDEHRAAGRRRKRGNQEPVIASGDRADDRARRVPAEAVRDQPLAVRARNGVASAGRLPLQPTDQRFTRGESLQVSHRASADHPCQIGDQPRGQPWDRAATRSGSEQANGRPATSACRCRHRMDLARPQHLPCCGWRSDQRLAPAGHVEIASEIDDQQPVVIGRTKEANDQRPFAKRRAVEPGVRLEGDGGVLAAQPKQIAVQPDMLCCPLGRFVPQFAVLEGGARGWIGRRRCLASAFQSGELAQKLLPPLAHTLPELALMIRKIQKRSRVASFLALKEERYRGSEQQQRGQRAELPWRAQLGQPSPGGRVRNLVVILEEMNELVRWPIECRCSTTILLPAEMLSLKEEPTLRGGQQFLARPAIVGVVRLAKPCQRDAGGVMEIVVVQRVQLAAATIRWTEQLRLLGLVLGNDHDPAICGCRPRPSG